jgi:hypothetical protein
MDFGNSKEMKDIMTWYKSCLNEKCSNELEKVKKTQLKKAKIFDEKKEELMEKIGKIQKKDGNLMKVIDVIEDTIPTKIKEEEKTNSKNLQKCAKKNDCLKITKKNYDILMSEFEKMKEKMLQDTESITDPVMRHTLDSIIKQFDNLLDLAKKSLKEDKEDDKPKTRSSKKKRSGKKNQTKKE